MFGDLQQHQYRSVPIKSDTILSCFPGNDCSLFQFPHLLQEVKQFLSSIASAKRVTTLLTNLKSCFHDNVKGGGHAGSMLHEVRSFLDSSRHFLDQMQTRYPLYRDLLVPFWAGLAQVNKCILLENEHMHHNSHYVRCIISTHYFSF